MSQFLADAGSLTVAWQHLCFVRQHAEMAQAVDDAEHAAAREIGSADGALEEGIALSLIHIFRDMKPMKVEPLKMR